MKPPYRITHAILQSITSISQKIGEVNARSLVRQDPKLRKQNQIRTIHSSLSIEGNTLSESQITAIVDDKRVVGPAKDIKEVLNALEVYKALSTFKPTLERDFLKAHSMLMAGLVHKPGCYRTKGVGIVQGKKVAHLAPPYAQVRPLMRSLFAYLKDKQELTLIKSCVFHYEMEFIHPFMDGNGRMGRLWQTRILMQEYPLFEFLPFETLIANDQASYYQALASSDKAGNSTKFIEYMLSVIDRAMDMLLEQRTKKIKDTERLEVFLEISKKEFTRKDYMKHYPDLSSATASRDLKNGVEQGLLKKSGDKKTSTYKKH